MSDETPSVFVIGLTPKLFAKAAADGYIEVSLPPMEPGRKYSIALIYGRDSEEVVKTVESAVGGIASAFPDLVEGKIQ